MQSAEPVVRVYHNDKREIQMKRLAFAQTVFVSVSCALTSAAFGQQDFSGVQIKATHVAGNVYMLEGRGGNIGVSVGSDGILIVDDQFAPLADKIKAALKELGRGKLRFVLNTHWHADHTGGNPVFGPQATIIAHTNVRHRLSTTQEIFGRVIDPAPKHALPLITFDDSLSIHFNEEEIRARHYPHSHTDGDSAIFFVGSNVVHMGDMFFSGMFPFVDISSGGDIEGLTRSVKDILAEIPPDAKIIPGHGPLSTVAELKLYHRMLTETTAIVRDRIKQGKTLEQIQSQALPPEWAEWGTGFIKTDRWLEIIHRSLSK